MIIVGTPVRHIFTAGVGDEIEVFQVSCAGTQPTDWPPAARTRNGVEGIADDPWLLFGTSLRRRIALVMPHPFPMSLRLPDGSPDDDADIAVDAPRDGGAHAVAIEQSHQSEYSNAVASNAHRPDRNIGILPGPRPLVCGPRLEREEFDIGNDPEGQPCAARLSETRAPDDWRIRKGTVGTGFHDVTRLRPEPTEAFPDRRRRFQHA